MSPTTPRVRFAPSPTGYLHIGGARTALFNWLWAKKLGGKFILRIEDTDLERNLEEAIGGILEALKWLGLQWDEGPEVGGPHGPYFQSQRLSLYREHAERMVASGTAYRCYSSKEELAALREAHAASGSKEPWRYPRIWRDRKDWPKDQPYVIRLKTPLEGSTAWNDLVKGRIEVPNSAQQDVVLMRNDGIPLYNFSAVVDDALMDVNLVARGDDHVVNTPLQIMVYQALGFQVPRFAHVPMILSQHGDKLSKRHAAVNALEYRDQGFLPDAMINYLARLGWSHGDQEIFAREELLQKFDWEHVGNTGARFDTKKLNAVQGEHLRKLTAGELKQKAEPFFARAGVILPDTSAVEAALQTVNTRAVTLNDVVDMSRFYFSRPSIEPQAQAKFLTAERMPYLQGLIECLDKVPAFKQEALEQALHAELAKRGWQLKDVAQPARVALTGRTQSPGLYEMMEVLGKEETLARLKAVSA